MNILVSTTQGHNPGDEIIWLGVRRLIEACYGTDNQYFFYNRNPDLQAGDQRQQRSGLVGNYMTQGSLLKHMDMVVLAGSPEWYGGPMEALYQAIETYAPDIPLLALGIGLGSEWGSLTKLDQRVLARTKTKVVTRSFETVYMLSREGIPSRGLVCPALFAFEPAREALADKTLLILQKPGHGWHEVRHDLYDGTSAIKDHPDVLCLHMKEFEYFSDLGYKPLYSPDPETFSRVVSQYSKVISTRLHGAIGALSLGIPAVVVANGDFRIETCASMFGSALPVARSVRDALDMNLSYKDLANYAGLQEEKWMRALNA